MATNTGTPAFEPPSHMVDDITNMGFTHEQSLFALKATGCASSGVAINFLFDNPMQGMDFEPTSTTTVDSTTESKATDATPVTNTITNTAISPATATSSAQPPSSSSTSTTADAFAQFAQAFLQTQQEKQYKMVIAVNMELKMGKGKLAAQCAHGAVSMVLKLMQEGNKHLEPWLDQGQRKVVVKIDSKSTMDKLYAQGLEAKLPVYTIQDAGRTQVKPGSHTVLVVGPAPAEQVDTVTSGLKLL